MSTFTKSIEKIANPDPDFFYNNYVKKARPVIITGLASQWPALTIWNFDFLKEKLSQHSVLVQRSRLQPVPSDPVTYLKNRYWEEKEMGGVIDLIRQEHTQSGLYITYGKIFQKCPDLLNHVQVLHKIFGFSSWCNEKIRDRLCLPPGFWLGPAGTITPVHFDRQENLSVQICGRKKWVIFSPEQSDYLYFEKNRGIGVIFSPVDIAHPDLIKYPLYQKAQATEVIVGPGEVIYIPPGWWHYVEALDESITLNYWWWSLGAVRIAAKVRLIELRRKWAKKLAAKLASK